LTETKSENEEMTQQEVTTRYELERAVIMRAWKDPEFLAQLKQDPVGTIQREFKVEIPSHVKVRLVEEDENELCLVIPLHPATYLEFELSDDVLAAAAGGVYNPHFDLLEGSEYKGGKIPPGYHLVYGVDPEDINKAWLKRDLLLGAG
jgi:hypothetical protein